jgi:deoxyadenosine/deoxycytidine kinase
MSFLADRYQQLSDDLAQDLFKDFLVADYHIFKSLIFAKITLAEDEYRLYRNLLILFIEKCKARSIFIYQNSERLLQNIKKRKSYEQKSQGYLDKINSGYLEYIKSQTECVLIIDVSDRDFVKNQEDYLFYFLNAIQNKINQL